MLALDQEAAVLEISQVHVLNLMKVLFCHNCTFLEYFDLMLIYLLLIYFILHYILQQYVFCVPFNKR